MRDILIVFLLLVLIGLGGGAYWYFIYRCHTSDWSTKPLVALDPTLTVSNVNVSLCTAQVNARSGGFPAFTVTANTSGNYDVYYYPTTQNTISVSAGTANLYYLSNTVTVSSSSGISPPSSSTAPPPKIWISQITPSGIQINLTAAPPGATDSTPFTVYNGTNIVVTGLLANVLNYFNVALSPGTYSALSVTVQTSPSVTFPIETVTVPGLVNVTTNGMQVTIKLNSLPQGQYGGFFQINNGDNLIISDDMNKLISPTGFTFSLQPGTYSNIKIIIGPNIIGVSPFTVNPLSPNAPQQCNATTGNNVPPCDFTAWCGTYKNQSDCNGYTNAPCQLGLGVTTIAKPCNWG